MSHSIIIEDEQLFTRLEETARQNKILLPHLVEEMLRRSVQKRFDFPVISSGTQEGVDLDNNAQVRDLIDGLE